MTSVPRPGRVQRIAVDETPLHALNPDVDARLGWLLAMSRLHHEDPAMLDGAAFLAALRRAGLDASRSLVSRWEAGRIPATYDGMAAYERALGLEPGRIRSLAAYVRAITPGARVARPPLHPGTPGFADRLDHLVERAEDGHVTASEWADLAWHLAASPHVHLRAHTWERLAHDIVSRVPRALRAPYRSYAAAAVVTGSVPRAQDFLTDAVEGYVATSGVEVTTNPIGLLARLPTPRAARITLDLLENPPTEAAFGIAVWVATQKVRQGILTEDETAHLDMLLLAHWRRDAVAASNQLAELVASLPEGLRSAFTSAADRAGQRRLRHAVETGEDFPEVQARSFSNLLSDAARAKVPQEPSYAEDLMFARLVREALFHRDQGRRHVAALTLAASPFGDALCDEVLTLLAGTGFPHRLRARAASLAGYLAHDVHRLRVLRLADDADDQVATHLLQALGHMTSTHLADHALRTSLKDQETMRERAKVYALGMSGSPGLRSIARSSTAPHWQRSAARWWLEQGPALRS